MNEILDELEKDDNYYQPNRFPKLLLIILIILFLGVYFGNLFFGQNSLEIFLNLKNEKESIDYEIDSLIRENARLQKEYFELKDLEP